MPSLILAAPDVDYALGEVEIAPTKTPDLDAPAGRIHCDHSRAVRSRPFILARRCLEQVHLVFDRKRTTYDGMVLWQVVDVVGNLVPTFGALQHPSKYVDLHIDGPACSPT